jgi:glutamate racemase
MSDPRPVAIFDSGVGGLTVVRSFIDLLPNESVTYFGDTARAPYGPRTRDEVRGFSLEIARYLMEQDPKMLIVACNAVSSAGLDHIAAEFPDVPILEVVQPAVRGAVRATRNGRIGVIGTQLTIDSGAYDRAIADTGKDVTLFSQACPRFVELIEEGVTDGSDVYVAHDYLAPLLREGVDTLILGCTHYPLLMGVITFVMGREIVQISSAEEAAREAFVRITESGLRAPAEATATYRFACSGDPTRFETLGRRFLGPQVGSVEARAWN